MIRFIALLVTIPVIVVIAAFAYRNAQSVSIDFFTTEYHIPLAAVILVTLIVGVILGFLLNLFVVLSQQNKLRQMKKQRKEMMSLSQAFNTDKK